MEVWVTLAGLAVGLVSAEARRLGIRAGAERMAIGDHWNN